VKNAYQFWQNISLSFNFPSAIKENVTAGLKEPLK